MAVTFAQLDTQAQTVFGEDSFYVSPADYASLLASMPAAAVNTGQYIQYQANMGGGVTRNIRVYVGTGPGGDNPVDPGVVDGA